MPLSIFRDEKDAFSKVSALFFISFASLLLLGTLSMAFASFELGVILYILGLVLVVGNDAVSARSCERGYGSVRAVSFIPELVNFAAVAYVFPILVALAVAAFVGTNDRLSFVVFAGMAATGVKVLIVTARLLMREKTPL